VAVDDGIGVEVKVGVAVNVGVGVDVCASTRAAASAPTNNAAMDRPMVFERMFPPGACPQAWLLQRSPPETGGTTGLWLVPYGNRHRSAIAADVRAGPVGRAAVRASASSHSAAFAAALFFRRVFAAADGAGWHREPYVKGKAFTVNDPWEPPHGRCRRALLARGSVG
jgi:hypothetical protein